MEKTRMHFSKPFQLDGSQILERVPQLNGHVPDRLGNKDLAGPGKGAEPGGEVHRVAEQRPLARRNVRDS